MTQLSKKLILLFAAVLSSGIAMLNSGCASGGYYVSRQFAGWINKQGILLRIVLYLFLGGAFFFTIIADMLVFNTMDFWTGKVSQGTYEFKDAGKVYVVKHSFIEGNRKKSEILVNDANGKKIQEVVFLENKNREIECYTDGVLKAKVDSIESLPKITYFDKMGKVLKQEFIPENVVISQR